MTANVQTRAREVRLGLCGCGWVFRHCYRPALLRLDSEFEIVAVFDPDPDARRVAASTWPSARVCETLDALLAARPDAVVVASPNAFHVEHASAVLIAGLSCLVEKPAVRGIEDAGRLLAALRPGAALFSGVASRYRRDTQHWLQEVAALGPLTELDLLWTREQGVPAAQWHLRRDNGWTGVFADLGYHLLDIAGAALQWPRAEIDVSAVRRSSRSQAAAASWYRGAETIAYDTDDRFEASASIAGSALHIRANWIDDERGDLVRLRARGLHGEAVLEGLFGFSDNRRQPAQCVLVRRDGEVVELQFPPGPQLQLDGFENLLRDFHAAVVAGRNSPPDDLMFIGRLADGVRMKQQ